MPKRIEYTPGQRMPNSNLVFLHEVKQKTKGRRRALFKCDCGVEKEINIVHVTNGKIVSCGCYFNSIIHEVNKTHGQSTRANTTGAYRSWVAMHHRVKVNPLYADITVCDSWEDFENFFTDMGERPHNHSIERVDSTKGYCPSNCVWATPKTQANNTSRNLQVSVNDMTRTIAQWCELTGLNPYTVYTRIRNGMSPEDAVVTPLLRTNGKPK